MASGGLACALMGGRALLANRLGPAVTVAGAAAAAVSAGRVLLAGPGDEPLRIPWSVPFGSFSIAIDELSAVFVLAIAVVCGLAAVYGGAYLKA